MEQIQKAIIAAAGSFFAVTLFFGLIILFCRKQHPPTTRRIRPRTRTLSTSDCTNSVAIGESASFDPSINRVSMPELLQATRGFSTDLIIGDGSFGLVYRACLSTGVTVAVKKLNSDAYQGFREFRAEMETLSKLRHPNIVKILGYCVTGSDRILIYEYIENGNLDDWLLETTSSGAETSRVPLPWELRVKVVIGVANALNYMHNLEVPIIHRDIKTSNVLLDSQFEPHLADFGLARRMEGSNTHVSTLVAGTMGYMPPEYFGGATMATTFGDVYSFGVLMLEVATGIRPNWHFKVDEKNMRLVEWARKMAAENRHLEMLDANVSREGLREGAVVEYFTIAANCTSEMPKTRPPMSEVVQLLNGVLV